MGMKIVIQIEFVLKAHSQFAHRVKESFVK